jgi:hypothetical protein
MFILNTKIHRHIGVTKLDQVAHTLAKICLWTRYRQYFILAFRETLRAHIRIGMTYTSE